MFHLDLTRARTSLAIYKPHALLKILIRMINGNNLVGLVTELKVPLTSYLIAIRVRLFQYLFIHNNKLGFKNNMNMIDSFFLVSYLTNLVFIAAVLFQFLLQEISLEMFKWAF